MRYVIHRLRFVDRGKFVESDGEPVLSIVGEVKSVKDMPVAVSIREKEIALSDNRILDVFLQKENVTNGKEYISYIVNVSAKNFPIFVFCKYFLDKVAKHFWTLLHVQIGQSCKALASHDQTSHLMPCRHF